MYSRGGTNHGRMTSSASHASAGSHALIARKISSASITKINRPSSATQTSDSGSSNAETTKLSLPKRPSSVVSLPPIDRSNSLVSARNPELDRWEDKNETENRQTDEDIISRKENSSVLKSNTFNKADEPSEPYDSDTEGKENTPGVFLTNPNTIIDSPKKVKKKSIGRPPVDGKKRRQSKRLKDIQIQKSTGSTNTPDSEPDRQNMQASKKNIDSVEQMSSSRNESAKLHKSGEYVLALGNLRRLVELVNKEIDDMKRDFHGGSDQSSITKHIKNCNSKLVHCQQLLKTNAIKPNNLDSEMTIVALLNNLRISDSDSESLEFVTELWENLKQAIERCHNIRARFESMIYRRLRLSCQSAKVDGDKSFSQNFSENIQAFVEKIDENIYDLNNLCRSFANGLKPCLFTEASTVSDTYVSTFLIMRLVPEMTGRLSILVSTSRQWIDADENYVRKVSAKIRENVARATEKQSVIEETKPKYRKMIRTVKIAELMCQNQKTHLRTIEAELSSLEAQLHEVSLKKRYVEKEVYQKESMVDFLQISISRTRHNQTLQMKRTRLIKRLTELEKRLTKISERCVLLTDQLNEKMAKRAALVESLNGHQNTYISLKDQLSAFSEKLQQIKKEIIELQEYISHFQQIQDIKLQPESIEEFYDRPPSVKLAPSLKEKINNRKRALKQSMEIMPLLSRAKRKIPTRMSDWK